MSTEVKPYGKYLIIDTDDFAKEIRNQEITIESIPISAVGLSPKGGHFAALVKRPLSRERRDRIEHRLRIQRDVASLVFATCDSFLENFPKKNLVDYRQC